MNGHQGESLYELEIEKLPENKVIKAELIFALDTATGNMLAFATRGGNVLVPLTQDEKQPSKMVKGAPQAFSGRDYFGPQKYLAEKLGAADKETVTFGNMNQLLGYFLDAKRPNKSAVAVCKPLAAKFAQKDKFDLNNFGEVLDFMQKYSGIVAGSQQIQREA